jgi:hypothetical protein
MDVYGCHITIEKLGRDKFHVTVTYEIYNDLGVHVGSPFWGEIGTGEKSYKFLQNTLSKVMNVNHPVLDIPLLKQ